MHELIYQNVQLNIQQVMTLKQLKPLVLQPGEIKLIPTGLKAYMQSDEVLYMYDRSSNPQVKKAWF